LATFVLGQDTIQGAEWLDDVARRRGFGDRMRDAAEKVTGMVAVPHGRNFTVGSLSEAASRSWDKRAEVREVLGYGNDVALKIRAKLARICLDRLREMSAKTLNLSYALALAERTSFPLQIGYLGTLPAVGWVVGPLGVPLDPSGIMNPNKLREFAQGFASPGNEICFKQMTLREADAVIERDWRKEVSSSRNDYVAGVMAALQSSATRGTPLRPSFVETKPTRSLAGVAFGTPRPK
jgi:hypothetical protein